MHVSFCVILPPIILLKMKNSQLCKDVLILTKLFWLVLYLHLYNEIVLITGNLESSPYYYKFLQALLRLLAADENLLEDRGAFIIR